MRVCRTKTDLLDLLADYQVVLNLTDNIILVEFPPVDEEPYHICGVRTSYNKTSDGGLSFKRVCKSAISDLLNSSEFWRKTTVASQIHSFTLANKELNIRTRKKANEFFKMIFKTCDEAVEFYRDLQLLNMDR